MRRRATAAGLDPAPPPRRRTRRRAARGACAVVRTGDQDGRQSQGQGERGQQAGFHHAGDFISTRVAGRKGAFRDEWRDPAYWPQMPLPLERYGLIGDTQTAALVGDDGSIDWLCLPRFDSAACFAALLGEPEHGRWLIAPAGEIRARRRRYRPNSLVLEAEYDVDGGTVRVTDCMPPRQHDPDSCAWSKACAARCACGWSWRCATTTATIVAVGPIDRRRLAADRAGPTRSRSRWAPASSARREDADHPRGVHGEGRRSHPVHAGVASVERGRRPSRSTPLAAIEDTDDWWCDWLRQSTDGDGPWRDVVARSYITLKALTFAPTGGIVAAPTTSLPEKIGGVRNWDYRYCWLRDATFTLYALMSGGFKAEALALARLAAARGGGRSVEAADHVRPGRRAPPARVRSALAARLRRLAARAHRQRRGLAAAARCLRRGDGRAVSGAPRGHSAGAGCVGAAARAAEVSRGRLGSAGRRHLGSARAAAAFHAFEGDGVGGVRSRDQDGGEVRRGRAGRSLAGRCATRCTPRSARKATTRRAARSRSTTARRSSTPPAVDAAGRLPPNPKIRACAAPSTPSSAS